MNETLNGNTGVRLTRAQVKELLNAYYASGLTQTGFAREHGLKVSALRYWLHRDRREKTDAQEDSSSGHFREVRVAHEQYSGDWILLRFPGEVEVCLPSGTSSGFLANLLRGLRAH